MSQPRNLVRAKTARMNLLSLEERAVPATYTVSLLGDAGTVDGSDTTGLSGDIRYCVAQANTAAGADTIVFSPTTFASPSTITLGSTLAMTGPTTIDGTSVGGKNNIAISGGGAVRVFSLAGTNLAVFNNLSIIQGSSTTGGSGGGGGAILLSATAASVTFNNAIVADHTNTSTGGAISLLSGYTGLVSVNNSTFSGNQGTRGGAIYFWTTGALSVTGSTFSGNKATGYGGGAITPWSGSATITSSSFINNEATTGQGGALEFPSSATLVLTSSTFSGNKSATQGGAIHHGSSGNSTITQTTFDSNTATTNGGAISIVSTRSVVVNSSTLSNNSAVLGGGVHQTSGTITFTNSTMSGNQASGGGGGGFSFTGGNQNIRNSTVVFNQATTGEGGGFRRTGGTLVVSSSIIAKNTAAIGGQDGHSTAAVASQALNNSLIGIGDDGGITWTGTGLQGTTATPTDPMINATLALNGAPAGSTLTHAVLTGSPAIDMGNNADSLSFDQRGTPNFRASGGSADIGSFEVQVANPVGVGSGAAIKTAGGTSHTVTVVFSDFIGSKLVDFMTIGLGNIRVQAPDMTFLLPSSIVAPPTMDAQSITVDFVIPSLGAAWDDLDNGTYNIQVLANQVYDKDMPALPALPGTIGSFQVAIPTTFTVNNAGDAGVGTGNKGDLRYVIGKANVDAGADNIVFDPLVFTGTPTITLGSTLSITNPVTITGLGANLVTISGNDTVRIFDITAAAKTVNISDVTLTKGKATAGTGAAIAATGGGTIGLTGVVITGNSITGTGAAIGASSINLTVTNSTISNNTASSNAGGIHIAAGSNTVTINNSTFDNNVSSSNGGAFSNSATTTLNIDNSKFTNNKGLAGGAFRLTTTMTTKVENSTISGNQSTSGLGGGFYVISAGALTIINSTIANNTATTAGGAISVTTATVTITNSTISGNKANSTTLGGGGISVSTGPMTINNSTIANNSAPNGTASGGGIRKTSATGTLTLNSTIVAKNTAPTGGPDIHGTVAITVAGGNNLVGVGNAGAFTLSGTNKTGTSATPLDPLLQPLASNGGPTQTHLLTPGSQAQFNGSNALVLPYDQRGVGYPRTVGGKTDVGATQSDGTIPGAAATGPTIAAVSMNNETITVTYSVGVGVIDATTFDNNDIVVTGPGMYSQPGTLIGGPYANGASVAVTYTVPPNNTGVSGQWDDQDNGTYVVNMQLDQVKTDMSKSVPTGAIGSFQVAIPRSFEVDKLGDDDDGIITNNELTFREALKLANGVTGTTDTITFDATVFTAGTIISLSSGYKVSDSVVITGPGVANLEFNGGASYRVFEISDGTAGVINVTMSGLKVSGGAVTSGNGAGFLVTGEKLSLTNVEISSNNTITSGNGGGISLTGSANLTLEGVRVIANSATGNGGGIDGGPGGSTITINNSTIANNTNTGNGPGISNGSVVMTITNSTISGNTSSGGSSIGGGIGQYAGKLTIENSTISNNQASQGGGIGLQSWGDNLQVRHTTITGNNAFAAAGNGGGIARVSGSGTITLFSSAVTGNVGVAGPDVFSAGTVNVNYSAVFSNLGFTLSGTSKDNVGFGVNAKLGPLGSYGGPTDTHVPDQGSPLFNAGPSMTALMFDQRGQARLQQTRVDIGSVESLNLLPTAKMNSLGPITISAATPDVVTIVYTDNGTVTASSIKTGNIKIFADKTPMVPLTILSATPTPNSNAPVISVDYKFAVPGGQWKTANNDTYRVQLLAADSVVDNDSNPVVTMDSEVGSFVVAIPAEYLVDEATDIDDLDYTTGKLSIREAIQLANGDNVDSKILFDASKFPANTKVDLLSGTLKVTEPVTITGPGRNNLLLDGQGLARVFEFDLTTANGVVAVSDLTMQNGNSGVGNHGGGILNSDANLQLTRVTVTGNTANLTGGGMRLLDGAKVTLTDSTVSNNTVPTGTGLDAGDGGGISVASSSTSEVHLINSTVSGNTANDDGGGIYFFTAGILTVTNSTVSGNTATVDDGGGFYFWTTTVTITNSTISGNNAGGSGGGLATLNAASVTVRNSTVVNNSSLGGGGNIFQGGGTITLNSTIVADGVGTNPDIGGTVTTNFSLIENTTGWTVGGGSGTNVTGLDPMLDALALNGAPAGSPLTHALQSGSPAIDQGIVSTPPLALDQRGSKRTSDFAAIPNAAGGDGTDIGSFEVQAPAATPPTVTAILTNGVASGQHSRVTSIVVNFSELVTIANPAAAFQINRYAGAPVGDVPATGLVGYTVAGLNGMNQGTSVTITFNGSGVVGVDPGNSLRDGKYLVTIVAAEVAGPGGQLDGDGNGTGGDNKLANTWRLFGDDNGDGQVTAIDFSQFRLAYGSPAMGSPAAFDFNNDGNITAGDFNEFRLRYGLTGYNIP